MIWYRILIGVILVLCSTVFVGFILDHYAVSLSYGGQEYAELIITKILDAIGGSLIIWGILKNPKK